MSGRQKEKPTEPKHALRAAWVWIAGVVLVAASGLVVYFHGHGLPKRSYLERSEASSDAKVFAAYGKSSSCISCHEDAYKLWQGSHHALAERPINAALDAAAFQPAQKVRHGSQTSELRSTNGRFHIATRGLGGGAQLFSAERVIGVDPLRQYMIPERGGRMQVSELAFDPKRQGWFDIYGEEDRQPGEWGHWTGRGMTWNSMCAECHNTRLRKNYDER